MILGFTKKIPDTCSWQDKFVERSEFSFLGISKLGLTLCLIFVSIWYVGLTCAMFKRDGVEIPCPDSTAGLYIKTRTDQIVCTFEVDNDFIYRYSFP